MAVSADVECSSGVVTASQASGENAPLRTTTSPSKRCSPLCSLWSLNAVAAAMHGVWFIVFVLLWALVTNDDGTKRDIEYPLWYSAATFGALPDPPVTDTTTGGLTLGQTEENSKPVSPYPSCEPPKASSVGNFPVSPAFRDTGITFSLHWLVVSFFALSFLFQATAAVVDAVALKKRKKQRIQLMGDDDEVRFEKDAVAQVAATSIPSINSSYQNSTSPVSSWFRFIEYSLSASVMVVAIALQVGLFDAWLLFACAALTWVTMMLGLVAERVFTVEEHLCAMKKRTDGIHSPNDAMKHATDSLSNSLCLIRWTSHFSAWVTQGVVFVIIIAHFFNSQQACEWADSVEDGNRQSDNTAPKFVYAIVFAELALFLGFGVTQLSQFVVFDKQKSGAYDMTTRVKHKRFTEAAYIVQSFVSKTVLGWLVYGGNFAA